MARNPLNQGVAIAAACVILERSICAAAIWTAFRHSAPNKRQKKHINMTQNDSQRGEPRASAESPAFEGKASKTDRDAESRAVLDNMARLKALRLAREAIEPPPAAKKVTRAKPGQKTKSSKKDDKPKALSDWLASQQNGGRRV
jgi:Mg-chelatase subunit ChlI